MILNKEEGKEKAEVINKKKEDKQDEEERETKRKRKTMGRLEEEKTREEEERDMWTSFKLWLWLLTEVMSLEKTDSHSPNKYQLLIAPKIEVCLHRQFPSPWWSIAGLSFINSK